MAKNKKSQSAIEFIIIIGFVLFSVTSFFLLLNEKMSDSYKENEQILLKEIATSVRDEIRLASESTDGYKRSFKIPENINGKKYDINLTDEMVFVRTFDNTNAISLHSLPANGNINKGDNTIIKEGGRVFLNV